MVDNFHHVVNSSAIPMVLLIHEPLVEVVNLLHLQDFHNMAEAVDNHWHDTIHSHHDQSYDKIHSHRDHDLYRRLVHHHHDLFLLLLLFQLGC